MFLYAAFYLEELKKNHSFIRKRCKRFRIYTHFQKSMLFTLLNFKHLSIEIAQRQCQLKRSTQMELQFKQLFRRIGIHCVLFEIVWLCQHLPA